MGDFDSMGGLIGTAVGLSILMPVIKDAQRETRTRVVYVRERIKRKRKHKRRKY